MKTDLFWPLHIFSTLFPCHRNFFGLFSEHEAKQLGAQKEAKVSRRNCASAALLKRVLSFHAQESGKLGRHTYLLGS